MQERIYTLETHGPQLTAFLNRIIELAGLDLSFEIEAGESPHPEYEDPELVVRFKGPDLEVLLANKAEALLALEYLTMEALHIPHDHHERICFDANDSRMLRIAELRLSAQTAAEKVKRSKLPFRFSPMTSRERRIIHLALRNETDVRSESAGVGPYRQVLIYPAGMPSLPESAHPAPRPPFRGPSGGGGSRPDRGDRDRDRGRGGRDRGGRRDR